MGFTEWIYPDVSCFNPDPIFLDFILNFQYPVRESFENPSRNGTRETRIGIKGIIIATIVDDVWCIGELERGMPMRQLEISTRSIHFRPDENEEDPADSKATKVRFSCPLFRRRCNVVLETLG